MAERELIYRTKVINDPASAAALKELGALASAVQGQIGSIMGAGAKATLEAAKAAHFLAGAERAAAGAIAEKARASAEASRGDLARLEITQKLAAEERRAANETRRAEQEATGAMGKQVKAQKEVIDAAEGIIGGVAAVGRGFVLTGLASEESMERVVGVLLKVQAVMDLAKGGAAIYFGIVKGVRAYETAIKTATAAEAALAAARARTAASGAAGAATSAAGGAVAGGGSSAIMSFIGPIVAASGPLIIVIGAIVAAYTAAGVAISYFADWITGAGKQTKDATDALAAFENRLRGANIERELRGQAVASEFRARGETADIEAKMRTLGLGGDERASNAAGRSAAASALSDITRKLAMARSGEDADSTAEIQITLEKERERILRQAAALDEDRLRMTKERAKEEMLNAQDILKTRKEELKTAQQITDKARDRLKSAEERLAGLDPLQARRVAEAARIAARGGELNRRQADSLRGLGVADDAIRSADSKRVKELGLSGVLDPLRKEVSAAEAAQRTAALNRDKAVNEISRVLSEESESLVKGMQEALRETYGTLVEQIRATIKAEGQIANRKIVEGRNQTKAGA